MSDGPFDRSLFASQLSTQRLGRQLVARAETASTNDDAWDAFAQGAPDGTVVVADVQTRGRGRLGRAWHTAPGRGLAMSLLLHVGCDPDPLAALPLVAGLALVLALERLGARPELEWPNDVLIAGRKLAGVLCECRRSGAELEAAVVGIGVNVSQRLDEFPPELCEHATSLALQGHGASREEVAAATLNAFEPLWTEHTEGDPRRVIEAWSRHASFWGRPVSVHTPGGPVRGTALGLDDHGALLIEGAGGATARVLAGDVELESRAPGGRVEHGAA